MIPPDRAVQGWIALIVVSSLVLALPANADYATFKGDSQRTGNLSGSGPHEPELLWSISPTGHGYIGSAAVVGKDRIFVCNWPDMTFKGELGLACLNRADGKVIWVNPLGGNGGASTPALDGGRIYVGSLSGDLFSVDAVSGETIWNRTIETKPGWWGVASSPLIQGGKIYVMSFSDGMLHALSLDGEELWNRSTGEVSPFLSPAGLAGRVYLPGGDPALYCLDGATGDQLWKKEVSTQITATPALYGGLVFLVTKDAISALDAENGSLLWSAGINGTISSPAICSGRVYVGSDDSPRGHLSCFDAAAGTLIWRAEASGPVKSSPLVLDGMVYFGTSCEGGAVYALHSGNGSEAWSYPVGEFVMSTASASDGTVYMGADDGRLYAFGSLPKDLLWEGEVQLDGRRLNLTAISGKSYPVNASTALGALVEASNQSNLSLSLNDSLHDLYGLQIESLGEYRRAGEQSWRYCINYPKEAMPTQGPDLSELRDGDRAIFYFGDRRASPEESPCLEITTRVLIKRSEALFLSVGGQLQLSQAAKTSPLNVTLSSFENASNFSSFSSYDLIFIEMIGSDAASRLAAPLQQAARVGVPIIVINSEGYDSLGNVNLTDHPFIQQYWDSCRVENMQRLLTYLAANFCGLKLDVKEPMPIPKEYIYHPDYPDLFENLTSYLNWYSQKEGHRFNASAPTIGIISYYQDLGEADRPALIYALEAKGANVIDLGLSGSSSLKRFFVMNNSSIIDAAVLTKSFRLNYGDPDQGIFDLQELGVPVMRAMRLYYQTAEEWKNSTGIDPLEIYFQMAQPEMDAVIEPIVISARNDSGYQPISSQISWLANRSIGWAELGRINNSLKKVAIIYYNHGAGKDNIEGCYLNIPRSLQNILDAMRSAGYAVNGTVPDEKALVNLLAHQGTNVGSWAPGELRAMAEAGNATLLPAEVYEQWFSALPSDKQLEVTKMWGPPPGKIMVYENESGKFLVIPKISFGNVILLPQPSRGWLENSTVLYHDKSLPPHHQYIAFYLWLKHGFEADAVVHLGKHGTEEWLPGKECGISSDDWPALLISDLPVVYPYIVDNIAEGTEAKRRGDAVMITHMTPPIVASGLYGNLTNLAETVYQYKNVENASVKEGYRRQILAGSQQMHLDEDLVANLSNLSSNDTAFDKFADDLQTYLYSLKSQYMPYGLHVFSQPPEGDPRQGLIMSMLGDDYRKEVARMIHYDDYPNAARLDKETELLNSTIRLLSEVVFNGTDCRTAQMIVLGKVSSNLTYLLNISLAFNQSIAACSGEAAALSSALNSSYTPPSQADDPIRDPAVLPTGRNFCSMDPRRIPTSAAWAVGSDLAEELIEGFRQDHNGSYPRKMAIVLWAWAMTDHGVVESEILRLVGAEPVYDSYGGVSDVRLIPLSELGRPRIDVVVIPSGLHRDLFPEKLQLIDRAIRLAANDTGSEYPNYICENTGEIFRKLMEGGNITEEQAAILSASRIFLEEAGTYGPNLDSPISASDTWENDTKIGNLFVDRMSYIYGDGIWSSRLSSGVDLSSQQKDLLRTNLAGVEAAAQHTNSNLYGFIDNDDVYQYLGGISLAVRTITGKAPDLYVTDSRDPDRSSVSSLHDYFSRELRSRYYNPRWIEGMMGEGYSGAREMDKFAEYLWGWEATVPDLVSENTWNEVHDIYAKDKYGLGLKEFFDENNPWASQAMTGRLLETARKERWNPSQAVLQDLVKSYDQSVQDYGVTCCHHTCGNLALEKYMQGVLPASSSEPSSSSSSASKSSSSQSSPRPEHHSCTRSAAHNQTRPAGFGGDSSRQQPADSSSGEVSGFVMEPEEKTVSEPSSSSTPAMAIGLVLAALFAFWVGFRGRL